MSDRDALLAAIRQSQDDDAPRLVYADWLDEHGDPDRAEFIRLQVEIDPFRRTNSDLDRWRRAVIDRHLDRPIPTDFPPELNRYAELARREYDLLKARRWDWLAPLARVDDDDHSHLAVHFRRGFAEHVALAASAFLEFGDLVRSACPVLRRLTLYGPRDQVHDLAAMPALGGVPELELGGWITSFDASALAPSLVMRGLESLTLWVGSHQHDKDVIRTLASRPWDGGPGRPPADFLSVPHLPILREVVLVQMFGGLIAVEVDEHLGRRANGLAGEFNRSIGRGVARVEQPWARRFPLCGQVGYGLLAGRMRGRPTLVAGGERTVVLQFDSHGGQTHEDILDLDDLLPHPPGTGDGEFDDRDLLAVLRRDHGFIPGPIFVREFMSEEADLLVQLWGNYNDVIYDPDSRSDGDDHEETCAALSGYWMRNGNFRIAHGDDYTAGPDGVIHSP
jgi:uncharacterized protein (TIGR02996 family)